MSDDDEYNRINDQLTRWLDAVGVAPCGAQNCRDIIISFAAYVMEQGSRDAEVAELRAANEALELSLATRCAALERMNREEAAALRARLHGPGTTQAAPEAREEMDCPQCDGDGEVPSVWGKDTILCPACKGSGKLMPDPVPHDSPLMCEHANECPRICPCRPGCYCWTRTCKDARKRQQEAPVAKCKAWCGDKCGFVQSCHPGTGKDYGKCFCSERCRDLGRPANREGT
jgi:hypothetical protein